jgi:hypothetical protein
LAVMRLLAAMIVVGLSVLASMTAPSVSSANGRTVPCGDAIGTTKFPYLGSSRPEYRYRQVLGIVAAPPAFMPQVVPTRQKPWAYWHKQGVVIRATGEAVTVTVPRIWRKRAAITWGNSGGPVSSLRIEGCGASADVGHAYAGGFFLRSPSACIPLIFSVGKHSATVRFGVGKRCQP